MFKAALIKDDRYYALRRWNAVVIILSSSALGLLVNFAQMQMYLIVGIITANLLSVVIVRYIVLRMRSYSSEVIEAT